VCDKIRMIIVNHRTHHVYKKEEYMSKTKRIRNVIIVDIHHSSIVSHLVAFDLQFDSM